MKNLASTQKNQKKRRLNNLSFIIYHLLLMFKHKACHFWKAILVLWIIFATIYVVYGEYNRLSNFVAKRAYNQGLTDAVTELIKQGGTCQPIPVNVDDKTATFISLECLQQPEEVTE